MNPRIIQRSHNQLPFYFECLEDVPRLTESNKNIVMTCKTNLLGG